MKASTPLIDKINEHIEKDPISFHVPGHKSGLIKTFKDTDFLKSDLTEISGLDDLHSPEEAIKESEDMLAELYKSAKSFFLVNGSTVGNLAMILGAVKPNSKVLVPRNSHKSVVNAIKLANAIPIFIPETVNQKLGVSEKVDISLVKEALELEKEITAIILTCPNYYGLTYQIKEIIDYAHSRNIPVLVDEAHGAHFVLGSPFPKSALDLGADVVVHSAHKTLPAMTMGSYLHFNSKIVDLNKIKEMLTMLQSSSPSYPIMASLDFARAYLQDFTNDDILWTLSQIQLFANELSKIDELEVIKTDDPLKLIVRSSQGEDGFSLQRRLEEHGVFTELADVRNILLILPLLKHKQYANFSRALIRIKKAVVGVRIQGEFECSEIVVNDKISKLECTQVEMEQMVEEIVKLTNAGGLISAETITPYPPGIPLILRGEKINANVITKLREISCFKGKIQGDENLKNGKIRVFAKI